MKATKLILAIALVIAFGASKAQNVAKLNQADKLFNELNYTLAAEAYKASIKDAPFIPREVVQKIAECYRMVRNYQEAERWYARVMEYPDYTSDAVYHYAQMLKNNAKYDKAKEQFVFYGVLEPYKKDDINPELVTCDLVKKWMDNPLTIEVNNERDINTKYAEFCPVMYENKMIFTSDRVVENYNATKNNNRIYGWTGNPYLKIFSTDKMIESIWSQPILYSSSFVSKYHDGPAVFCDKTNEIFLTRTISIDNPRKYTSDKEKVANFVDRVGIYVSQKVNGQWSELVPFKYNNLIDYSVGSAAVSPDGLSLYFASDMEGGFGGTDIYVCTRTTFADEWSEPVNLGDQINSKGNENFPSVAIDGTLYFSSNGWPGMGGLDIFKAQKSDQNWTLSNLQYPMNSPQDDFGLIYNADGKSGYFSSNRDGGIGGDDIYSFRPSQIVSKL
jgi:tetratricopeptide (TPR) repeat protein